MPVFVWMRSCSARIEAGKSKAGAAKTVVLESNCKKFLRFMREIFYQLPDLVERGLRRQFDPFRVDRVQNNRLEPKLQAVIAPIFFSCLTDWMAG